MFIAFARFQHNNGGTLDADNTLEPRVIPVNVNQTIVSSSLRDTVTTDHSQLSRYDRYTMPSFGMSDNNNPHPQSPEQSQYSEQLILE